MFEDFRVLNSRDVAFACGWGSGIQVFQLGLSEVIYWVDLISGVVMK